MYAGSVFVLALCVVLQSAVLVPSSAYQTRYEGDQTITTFDGLTLHADGYIPIPTASNESFPLLIFPNSWGMPQIEYVVQAFKFAEDGFVTLEYETRGWYASGGVIDVAGPLDRRDISSVIDYAVSRAKDWNVNVSLIALVGISYGAGLSMEAAGFEPRLATVVSLSGWGNLTRALYDHDTPNKAWADGLELLADIVGHPGTELQQMIGDLVSHTNMSGVTEFSARRSAEVNLSFINERRIPVFVSNNFLDRLFKPNDMIEFWLKIEGPKFLLLNQGMHAQAEIGGLIGLKNYVWTHVKLWLQEVLQGTNTGIFREAPIQLQKEYNGSDYVMLHSWPDPSVVGSSTWLLGNRAGQHYGQLSLSSVPPARNGPTDVISYGELSGIFDGYPIVSDFLNDYIPTTNQLLVYVEENAIVFMGNPLATDTLYCGTPTYQLKFLPSSTTFQVYTILYDVDALDVGEVISDGFHTQWGSGGPNNATITLSSTMHMMCHTVPAGHRLAVGFVLYNAMYTNPNKDYNVVMFYDNETWVTLPITTQ